MSSTAVKAKYLLTVIQEHMFKTLAHLEPVASSRCDEGIKQHLRNDIFLLHRSADILADALNDVEVSVPTDDLNVMKDPKAWA